MSLGWAGHVLPLIQRAAPICGWHPVTENWLGHFGQVVLEISKSQKQSSLEWVTKGLRYKKDLQRLLLDWVGTNLRTGSRDCTEAEERWVKLMTRSWYLTKLRKCLCDVLTRDDSSSDITRLAFRLHRALSSPSTSYLTLGLFLFCGRCTSSRPWAKRPKIS